MKGVTPSRRHASRTRAANSALTLSGTPPAGRRRSAWRGWSVGISKAAGAPLSWLRQ
jgi:hypothetical protein